MVVVVVVVVMEEMGVWAMLMEIVVKDAFLPSFRPSVLPSFRPSALGGGGCRDSDGSGDLRELYSDLNCENVTSFMWDVYLDRRSLATSAAFSLMKS